MADFRDFIPADEDPGALGSGFTDYVPSKEPEKVVEKEEKQTPKKKAK